MANELEIRRASSQRIQGDVNSTVAYHFMERYKRGLVKYYAETEDSPELQQYEITSHDKEIGKMVLKLEGSLGNLYSSPEPDKTWAHDIQQYGRLVLEHFEDDTVSARFKMLHFCDQYKETGTAGASDLITTLEEEMNASTQETS